ASVAVLPVLWAVHRADQPSPARRRGAARPALRTRDCAGHGAGAGRGRATAAVAGRSLVSQSSRRRHRQYPPRRALHRQTVLARGSTRAVGPGRVPLVRNAAAPAHELGAAAALARADRLVLARATARLAGTLGYGPARPIHAGALRLARLSRRFGRSSRRRLSLRSRVVSCPARISFSVLR